MDEQILYEAGLTKPEAKIYALLIKNSPCPPPKLADMAGESRTNTYKLLDSLEEMSLVTRDESQPKLRYWANNPAALLDVIKKKRAEIESSEKRFQGALPQLIDEYFKHSEQPSIRYFHGKDGIAQIYRDQLSEAQTVTFIHSEGIRDSFGFHGLHKLRNEFPKRGISRHAFYPDVKPAVPDGEPTTPIDESDRLMLLKRTWLHQGDLSAPVEWAVYGNKLSIVSLGTELVGVIVESPQIAASFHEILALLDKKIRAESDYDQLPKNHTYTKRPEVK